MAIEKVVDETRASKTRRKPGQKAKLSRQIILKAALDVAARTPQDLLSLSSVAREIGVSPMAIYNHFENRDELLQAITETLLGTLVVAIPEDATPVEMVRIWACSLRSHFVKHPYLLDMLIWGSDHMAVAWINQTEVLLLALERLGLQGTARAEAVLWITNVITNAIRTEIYDRRTPLRVNDAEFERLKPYVRTGMAPWREMIENERYHDRFFNFQLDRLCESVSTLNKREQKIN